MVKAQIVAAIREIKNTLSSITLLSCFLDALLVLLLSVITLMLISVEWYWAIIPFIIYFYIHYKNGKKQLSLAFVEEKTPELKEELRTSADNLDKDNEIVMALHEEVLAKMRRIKVSDFIDFKKISRRMFVISILCFLILIFSAFNVSFIDINDLLDQITQEQEETKSPYEEEIPEEENRAGAGGSIFGEESIAELGAEELNLQINPVLSEIDINDVSDAKEKEFKKDYFEEDIEATQDKTYEEDK